MAAFIFLALLACDTLLTIPDEIQFIWRHNFNIVSAIFIMNRVAASILILDIMLVEVDNVRHLAPRVVKGHLTTLFRCEFLMMRCQLRLNLQAVVVSKS